jgi:hypothetical protein
MTPPPLNKYLDKMSWIVAITMTVAAVLLHFFSVLEAGGLWRDEVGMANIATLPSAGEIFQALLHDHCPMVYPLVVKSWMALGLAHTDKGLRIFGLCVGLGLIASFWAASRMMSKGLPLLSLAIVALNPIVIRYGDSMRGYALGMVFIIITMGLIWRFIEVPDVLRGLLAGFAAVLSVQTLYQNAFFLLAICIAGIVVSLLQRQTLKAVSILAVGFIAAITLIPYVNPIRHAQTWWIVSQSGTSLGHSFDRIYKMAGSFLGVWVVVMVFAIVFGIGRIFASRRQDENSGQPDLPLFGSIALVLGSIGFGIFIKLTGLPTQVWYYIPVFCFTAVCCDAVFPRVLPITNTGVLSIAAAALFVYPSAYSALRYRQTNGDLLAAYVAKNADPNDLIIVQPWYFGLTFAYYYRGVAKWTTLPPITDYRYHRYDLIKEKLQTPKAIEPVLQQAEKTLRSGHRIWIVGEISEPKPNAPDPGDPPPAPGILGWSDHPYTEAWGAEFGYFINQHIINTAQIVDHSTNAVPINPMEKMALVVASGWKTNSP